MQLITITSIWQNKKEKKYENKKIDEHPSSRQFSPPGEGFQHFGPEIGILDEISSLELAPNVKNPESRSTHEEISFYNVFFINPMSGFWSSTCEAHGKQQGDRLHVVFRRGIMCVCADVYFKGVRSKFNSRGGTGG